MTKKITPKSLVEIAKGGYSPEVVIETFRDYAETGAAISVGTAMEALARATLTDEQLRQVQVHLVTGIQDHVQRAHCRPVHPCKSSEEIEAQRYSAVYNIIETARKLNLSLNSSEVKALYKNHD